MLFLIQNRILTKEREKTYLASTVAPSATTLTVRAVDSNAWADNDWVIIGEIGTPNAEVMQINGAVSDGTSLTVDQGGSGSCRFAHSVDEPVYRIDYNKIRIYHSSTATGSKSTLATVELQPDNFETRYDDTVNTTGYGFATFFNSHTNAVSPYSDEIPYIGQEQTSLARMLAKVRSLTNELETEFITDEEIVDAINDKQRDILNERLWTFNEIERSDSSITNQFEYNIPSRIKTLHTVRFDTEPLRKIGEARWEVLHWDTDQSASEPTHCAIWNNKIRVYPRPSTGAAATQLNGAITASSTSIVVDDASALKRGDYYRFKIEDEIIYATSLSTATFSGCMRGQEGTTAAAHLDNTAVTELDIVFTGQGVAVDLENLNDETLVPEPLVICYGVSADLCHGKLNKETLGDRYDVKYKDGIKNLRDRYTLKLTSQFGRVKDPREVISDNGKIMNPNDFPSGVTAT